MREDRELLHCRFPGKMHVPICTYVCVYVLIYILRSSVFLGSFATVCALGRYRFPGNMHVPIYIYIYIYFFVKYFFVEYYIYAFLLSTLFLESSATTVCALLGCAN